MKKKVSELEGAELDYWVARACGATEGSYSGEIDGGKIYVGIFDGKPMCDDAPCGFKPSALWAHGGPIIERERLMLEYEGDAIGWSATYEAGLHSLSTWKRKAVGPTALIAAMRCYVASKFGEEVEVG